MVDSLFGKLSYILPSFEGKMEYDSLSQGTIFYFKFKNRRVFRVFISDLHFAQNPVYSIIEHLNLEVLNRRRELVTRQNEVATGYW